VRDIEGFYFATYRRWRGSKSDRFEDEADWEATDVTNARVPVPAAAAGRRGRTVRRLGVIVVLQGWWGGEVAEGDVAAAASARAARGGWLSRRGERGEGAGARGRC